MTAQEITSGLLVRIPQEFNARVWRVNVISQKVGDRFIRAGIKGMADISGIAGPGGRRLEIEVKAGRDRLRPEQASWGQMIERHGGIFIVARGVDQAIGELRHRLEVTQ